MLTMLNKRGPQMNDKETRMTDKFNSVQTSHSKEQARGQWNTIFKCQTINLELYTQPNYFLRTRAK